MSRPRRLDGFDYRGQAQYFLTFCVRGRRPVFVDPTTAQAVVDHFTRTVTHSEFALLAYCVMPDHAHLLVEGRTEGADLRRFAKRIKQGSGQAYAHRFGGSLWQEGYFEHVLRSDEDARGVARYILENPVRASLVAHPADYPHLGSTEWEVNELLDSII